MVTSYTLKDQFPTLYNAFPGCSSLPQEPKCIYIQKYFYTKQIIIRTLIEHAIRKPQINKHNAAIPGAQTLGPWGSGLRPGNALSHVYDVTIVLEHCDGRVGLKKKKNIYLVPFNTILMHSTPVHIIPSAHSSCLLVGLASKDGSECKSNLPK